MRVCKSMSHYFVKMAGFSFVLMAIFTLVFDGSYVWAKPSDRSNLCNPVLRIIPLSKAPKIDGICEDGFWTKNAQLNFKNSKTGEVPKKQTRACMGYREDGLYVFVQCEDNAIDKIAARITNHDGNVWEDDCVEVFWGRGNEDICHIIVNSKAVSYTHLRAHET